jgi:class 3 adenylate cyclase/DNA-binding beta-propeller fold protein YncE
MSLARRSRGLATILFLDIVGSTEIAGELGDRRWRQLLGQFRRLVRAELKRHGGHEEDTTGDGFFATFSQPADAVRSAVTIVRRVQETGIDVRCGVHFGEAEAIERRRGGIAVHIGSRVMSLAGPAQIMITSTVRDLVAGAGVDVEEAGIHRLKGVPGEWQLWQVRSLEGTPVPAPLSPDEAGELRARPATARRSRRLLIAVLGAIALLAMAVPVALLVTAGPPVPTLVRIDPETNTITKSITDDYRSEHLPNALWSVNGALWQGVTSGFEGLVRRDMDSGEVLQEIPIPTEPHGGAFGFGSVWMGGLTAPGSIHRWDAVTGREVASLSVEGEVVSIDASAAAVWVLTADGTLYEIDPISSSVVASVRTGTVDPGVVVALDDSVWICACEEHKLVEFDPAESRVLRTLEFAQAGFLVGLVDTEGEKTLWLLDLEGATVTPIDPVTGEQGQPIGVGANLHGAMVSFGSLWVAAGDKVLRVRGDSPEVIARIPMPPGMSAGSIAADPDTNSLWVADCGCPIE